MKMNYIILIFKFRKSKLNIINKKNRRWYKNISNNIDNNLKDNNYEYEENQNSQEQKKEGENNEITLTTLIIFQFVNFI